MASRGHLGRIELNLFFVGCDCKRTIKVECFLEAVSFQSSALLVFALEEFLRHIRRRYLLGSNVPWVRQEPAAQIWAREEGRTHKERTAQHKGNSQVTLLEGTIP